MPHSIVKGTPLRIPPLQPPNSDGLRLPDGFSSRVVAKSGHYPIGNSNYVWHSAPDGGATFATEDRGWIYVSNAEVENGGGGVGALRFDSTGKIISSYMVLAGTTRNCSGGATPWGTWLSCEETAGGRIWECDPTGNHQAVPRPLMGCFGHEAAAVDLSRGVVYLTEDERDGGFYRFIADRNDNGGLNLSQGHLEIAKVQGNNREGLVTWHIIPDPLAISEPVRRQVPGYTSFYGGEGIAISEDLVYFATKGDNQIWGYHQVKQEISIQFDNKFFADASITGVDSVMITSANVLLIGEDRGDMQIIAIDTFRQTQPLLQVVGHPNSEVTGLAFNPSGERLYFSSQRGHLGADHNGYTYEITGPFKELGIV